ncbi:hypothetical protein EHI8A_028420 [Entamoeba histolytica HM-1:IMSS-B]|uniref:Uncharacterized protein n=4 Tax=Entamoeba histolytica TaxID=5759 RepID=C4LWS9_ENTH1|nr:hypothetical protein EHI_198830 [Entamoeba histolytica HM-1:IMSS]EAL49602.1 hypothetical protein EHI_198830 [Entamoeba histolytica HM-1:IMSS]EMH75682.1 hypothetical protein EHI8A_028420 [Entamoeba histolytica HM-1:IMSS-B]ENY65676.1 hypothetical protein EHI7A_028310 [Entamoeba histolytica HM-1:IMSS-A]GAT93172.1 hypothetical protein CL6EHI_198830 [Entamoeba histolytica]|eukprot:XP_654988.1 hypothetical protein EHI_198830 [Entamoeba histolytica HM-1:IMSS]
MSKSEVYNKIIQLIDKIDTTEIKNAMSFMFASLYEKIINIEVQLNSSIKLIDQQYLRGIEEINQDNKINEFIIQNLDQIENWNGYNHAKVIYKGDSIPQSQVEQWKQKDNITVVVLTHNNQLFLTSLQNPREEKPIDRQKNVPIRKVIIQQWKKDGNKYINYVYDSKPLSILDGNTNYFIELGHGFKIGMDGKGEFSTDFFCKYGVSPLPKLDYDHSLYIKQIVVLEWELVGSVPEIQI